MAQPQHVVPARSVEQAAMERARGEVSDVLTLVDHALERAKRARKTVQKDDVDGNAVLALGVAVDDLTRLRKRLLQDTYFAGDTLRLL